MSHFPAARQRRSSLLSRGKWRAALGMSGLGGILFRDDAETDVFVARVEFEGGHDDRQIFARQLRGGELQQGFAQTD